MIENRAAGVPPRRDDDRDSGFSTVAQRGCTSTLRGQGGSDDKFATTWRPVGPVALAPLLLSPAAFPFNFGRYQLRGILGEGKMGSVFLARDKQLNRQVAMKIPKSDPMPESGIRFEREACVMAQVRHPNVCPVYDVGEFDGIRFFTMAYIKGETLAERLVADSSQSCSQTARLVRKLAIALDAVHTAEIVHRDLKPANIMIETAGEPIVMDFGLATSVNCPFAAKDGLVGTPAYMPPEQARGDTVGPAGDIYSLGVVMYEMLAGRLPFEGTLTHILEQVVAEVPPPPSRFNPEVDRKLEAICLRAMANSVEHRFPSAGALADALP